MAPGAAITPEAFESLCGLIRARSAIEIEAAKAYLVEARLTPVAQKNGLGSLTELAAALQKPGCGELQRQVIEAMTTNESSFYRDIHPFEALRTTVLPELIARRGTRRSLNIWSAACSSGQELYSIAMLIREHFPELQNWKITLLGTDLSHDILDRAKDGAFTQIEINRGLPSQLLVKYFRRDGVKWRICDELRQMARFEQLNLVQPYPAWVPKMDVVFLRNVLIYFSPQNKTTVLKMIRGAMEPDGYLFLGGAETTLNLDTEFERANVDKSVCYRQRSATPAVGSPTPASKT